MNSKSDKKYASILLNLKEKIRLARQRASHTINKELLSVYWEIGKAILEQKEQQGWGSKIIKQLALDLKMEFPDMKGFSDRNLGYMQSFAAAYPDFLITQAQPAKLQSPENQEFAITQAKPAQMGFNSTLLSNLSWYHHTTLLDKLQDPEIRLFYIHKAVENGWSRDIMVNQIESGLHKRQGALTHNFKNTLPDYQSDLTQQLFKDPYHLEFVMLSETAKERDLENALMNHITKLLLELGDGFAFMGRQRKFEAGGKEFFIDLLFYNTKLRRHIIIELKIGEFEPEFVSKMNLYLGLADDLLKGEYDEPAIGLILCKTKNKIVAEYALRDTSKPIGIAEYKISELLPEDIKGELPSIEEIEQKLDKEIEQHQNPIDTRLKAVKEKLKEINSEELRQPFSIETVKGLFPGSLESLYSKIIDRLKMAFEGEFLTHHYSWVFRSTIYELMEDLENSWKIDDNIKDIKDLTFKYELSGFIKAPTGDFTDEITLRLEFTKYWYGFTLYGAHQNHPFLKKLYHEQLSDENIDEIINWMITLVLDKIEAVIKKIENNPEIKKNN